MKSETPATELRGFDPRRHVADLHSEQALRRMYSRCWTATPTLVTDSPADQCRPFPRTRSKYSMMRRIPTLISALLLVGINAAHSQPDSCFEATPFEFFHCENFDPPYPQAVTLCYQFTTTGSAVDFSFGYFAFCSDLTVTYTLYNAFCDSITSNGTGNFDIAPGVLYVVCGRVECQTPGGIREVCTTEQLTLPVELVSFIAYPTENAVVLEWTTATEHDSHSFAILRSVDLVSWSALVEVPAAGQSVSTRVYRWSDTQPVPGTTYYQLKGTDIDGTSQMLRYIFVTWDRGNDRGNLWPFDLLGRRVRPE